MFRCVFTFLLAYSATALAEHNTLTILTWEEYLDPELVTDFESKTGIHLEFIYFEDDEVRDQIMAETMGFGFDVILVDDVEIISYIQQNWIMPLNKSLLPQLKSHGNQWYSTIAGAETHAVPYGWGIYGITYDANTVKEPPKSWADLFDPSKPYSGHINMSSQISELLAIALLANGYSPNDTTIEALNSAEKSLLAQQEMVREYTITDSANDPDYFRSGDLKVAMTYNSDSLILQDELDSLVFVTPTEGSIAWIDLWAISSKTQHFEEAHQLLDYLLTPEVVATNVEYHYTATFSEDAISLLPEEIRSDETVFPASDQPFYTMQAPNRDSIRTMMKVINAIELN
jgi:spermidine/putrescine transport system substrate-binding protein